MIWEPCLDDTCCPPLTRGGGITVPELLPVKIYLKKRKQNTVNFSVTAFRLMLSILYVILVH